MFLSERQVKKMTTEVVFKKGEPKIKVLKRRQYITSDQDPRVLEQGAKRTILKDDGYELSVTSTISPTHTTLWGIKDEIKNDLSGVLPGIESIEHHSSL